jgi:uncharacterized membrane protein (DUF485 family)
MHGESTKWGKDDSSVIKELVGRWLFLLYAVFYAGFIVINIVSPGFMGIDIGGLNMAIAFGFGLIVLAMLLAFAYNHISTKSEQVFAELAEKKNDTDEGETNI